MVLDVNSVPLKEILKLVVLVSLIIKRIYIEIPWNILHTPNGTA